MSWRLTRNKLLCPRLQAELIFYVAYATKQWAKLKDNRTDLKHVCWRPVKSANCFKGKSGRVDVAGPLSQRTTRGWEKTSHFNTTVYAWTYVDVLFRPWELNGSAETFKGNYWGEKITLFLKDLTVLFFGSKRNVCRQMLEPSVRQEDITFLSCRVGWEETISCCL